MWQFCSIRCCVFRPCCILPRAYIIETSTPTPAHSSRNKKAQLSLTNPRDAKACQKLLQFDVLTTLSLTILVYLHSFSCCCVRNLRNPAKFTKNSNLWSSRSSKVIDLGVNGKPICDFILPVVINSNISLSATVFEIFTVKDRKLLITHPCLV